MKVSTKWWIATGVATTAVVGTPLLLICYLGVKVWGLINAALVCVVCFCAAMAGSEDMKERMLIEIDLIAARHGVNLLKPSGRENDQQPG